MRRSSPSQVLLLYLQCSSPSSRWTGGNALQRWASSYSMPPKRDAGIKGGKPKSIARSSPLPSEFRPPSMKPNWNRSSFDIFQNLKSPPDKSSESADGKKRKPSERVLRLVDDILSLSLIEAADLCDLCQEGLQSKVNGPIPPGRTPFPHPGGMFAGFTSAGMMPAFGSMMPQHTPMMTPQMGTIMPQQQTDVVPPTTAIGSPPLTGDQPPPVPPTPPARASPSESEKSRFTFKLEAYENAKKVAVVKEVRAMLELGLKDAKETVEEAPKILKKGMPKEEAEKWKAKLEAVGATVTLL